MSIGPLKLLAENFEMLICFQQIYPILNYVSCFQLY